MTHPLLELAAAVIDWTSITPANVITWLVMVGGWVAFWVKLKDRVDGHGQEVKHLQEQMERHSEKLEDMKDHGTVSSRQALATINSRLDSQATRLFRVEEAMIEIKEIKVNVEWMRKLMQERKME